MRLISIAYLIAVLAIVVIILYPGAELAGAKLWLNQTYAGAAGEMSGPVATIVGTVVFATLTLLAIFSAFDL